MTNMTLIDNVLGVNLQASGDSAKSHTYLRSSIIYGETEAEDCPKSHNCKCMDKIGFMLFGSNHKDKGIHITSPSPLPHYKIKSYGTWAASAAIYDTVFEGFTSTETACGATSRIFELNPYSADFVPVQKFDYTTFKNVHQDVMTYLMDPPE
jgi:hypothetical protein